MKKLFIKKNLVNLIIILLFVIMTTFSKIEVGISWVRDINIWANAIILELLLYQIMFLVTIRIKNKYWRSFISLSSALIIGETINYNFNCINISKANIAFSVVFMILVVFSSYIAFQESIKNIEIKKLVDKKKISTDIQNMTEKDFNELIRIMERSVIFSEKYVLSTDFIRKNSGEEIKQLINDYKTLRNHNKQLDFISRNKLDK